MKTRIDSIAFKPGRISHLEIKNRLVRSAVFESLADEKGEVTDPQLQVYRKLAQGGVGLIITGQAAISADGALHRMTRIDSDEMISSIEKIASIVHKTDRDCKVMLQLSHIGRQILPDLGQEPVAPWNPVPLPESKDNPHQIHQ
jgi:2,4-dienoyl-CoA reductase-like NADH-dependent reductase (Old Yellow Enzyme family)